MTESCETRPYRFGIRRDPHSCVYSLTEIFWYSPEIFYVLRSAPCFYLDKYHCHTFDALLLTISADAKNLAQSFF